THPHFGDFSARSIFGWWYLVTFGSLVGYTAHVWLLDNAPLGTVATYAYVNPIVAIVLGAIVLHESLTWTIGVGALLVLACVAPRPRASRRAQYPISATSCASFHLSPIPPSTPSSSASTTANVVSSVRLRNVCASAAVYGCGIWSSQREISSSPSRHATISST